MNTVKKNYCHCSIIKPKENYLYIVAQGYISKNKPVDFKEVKNEYEETVSIANAYVTVVNQARNLNYVLEMYELDESAIYTYEDEEKNIYQTLKLTGFNHCASRMQKLMKPGTKIMFVGYLQDNAWNDLQGNKRHALSVTLHDFWVERFAKENNNQNE